MKHLDTQFLRAVAILLILNSHLDKFYPISCIGTGGAIGNSIFFFLSAYGLALSQQARPLPFVVWWTKRLVRIYPSLWIVLIALVLPLDLPHGKLTGCGFETLLGLFFNPPYWFLQTLLVFYLLGFPLLRKAQHRFLPWIFCLLALLYAGFYLTCVDLSCWSIEKTPFDRINYLMIFVFGIYMAQKKDPVVYSGPLDAILLVFFVGIVYGHKVLMSRGILPEWQIVQHVAMYPILIHLLKISRAPFISVALTRSRWLSGCCSFLADTTLEVFMIHLAISATVLKFAMPFPINMVVFLSLTFLLSYFVHRLAVAVQQRIEG